MADWGTISALATGAGTLALAGATFASVKSANRSSMIMLSPGNGLVRDAGGVIYLAMAVRNVGTGLAVLHAWHTGFWQGALRDPDEEGVAAVRQAIATREGVVVDLLYGDHEGGQRTISRFGLSTEEADGDEWVCGVIRHWSIDGAGPR